LKLHLQELVPPLSAEEPGALPPKDSLPAETNVWHDSSMELERGLDVVELSVELQECEPPESDLPAPSLVPKRR